jgi:hypothetical protein
MIAESSFQAGVFRQPWTRRRTLTSVREDALEHPSSSIGQTMHNSTQPMTPLAAVAAGLLAGAVGTVGLDAVHYLKYRRAGGSKGPLAWEFAAVKRWDDAPAPGQVARRVIEGFTQRELPDRWAWVGSTVAHWAYGSLAAGAYGVVVGSLRRPRVLYGVPFGAAVWAGGYVVLPQAGLYEPIWNYDARTLAWDLGAHLAYGAGTAAVFSLLTMLLSGGRSRRP